MGRRITWLVLHAICLLSFSGYCNIALHSPQRHLTTSDGLNTDTIFDVTQDTNGFLWVASSLGINTYDGYTIKKLNDSELNINKVYVKKVFATSDGGMLILYGNHGLYYHHPNRKIVQRIMHFDRNPTVARNTLKFVEQNQQIWVISKDSLMTFHLTKLTEPLETFVTDKREFTIHDGQQRGHILLLATSSGLQQFNLKTRQWLTPINNKQGLATTSIKHIIADSQKRLFGLTDSDIIEYTVSKNGHITERSSQPLSVSKIESVSIFKEYLYLGSDIGIYRYNTLTQKLSYYLSFATLLPHSRQQVVGQFIDRSGTLWLWGDNVGLFSLELYNPPFKTFNYNYRQQKSLSHPTVWGIAKSLKNPNKFWVSTTDGLNLINISNGRTMQQPITMRHFESAKGGIYTTVTNQQMFMDVVHETPTHLWIETPRSLLYIDKTTFESAVLPFSKNIRKVFARDQVKYWNDGQGRLWATNGKKLHYIELATNQYTLVTQEITTPNSLPLYNILGFKLQTNELLLSTANHVLGFHLDTQQTRVVFDRESSTTNPGYTFFESLVIDTKRNLLWLSHLTKGLYAVDATTFQHRKEYVFDLDQYGAAYSLHLDKNDYLWIASHYGILRFNPEKKHYLRFTEIDGTSSHEYNAFAFAVADDGTVLFGGVTGVTVFNPNQLTIDSLGVKNQIYWSELDIDGDTKTQLDNNLSSISLDIDYQRNNITLYFTDNLFHMGDTSQFEYKIENEHSIVKNQTNNNFVTLSQLTYGQSQFSIRSISPLDGHYSDVKHIILNVAPPFWRSDLAYGVYIIFFLMLAVSAWNVSSRSLLISHSQLAEKEQRFRLALVGSNSEVWEWHEDNQRISGRRITYLKGQDDRKRSIHHDKYIAYIHPEDRPQYIAEWQALMNSVDEEYIFSSTYRIQHKNGSWVWYKDMGRFVPRELDDSDGLISGTYSDVTDYQISKDKLQIYGEVLQRSHDWVLLINHDQTEIKANPALCKAFNIVASEPNISLETIFKAPSQLKSYTDIMSNMPVNGQWKGDEILNSANNKVHHLLVTISSTGRSSQRSYIIMMNDITELKRAEQELRVLVLEDQLTGLQNRRAFNVSLRDALIKAKVTLTPLGVCFIDLNEFKQINDTLGHSAGDELLKTIGSRLLKLLPSHIIASRVGGDEFTILIPDASEHNEVKRLLKSVYDTLAMPVTVKKHSITVTGSIGVSIYPEHGDSEEALLQHADLAMYLAKQHAIKPFLIYDPSMVSPRHQRRKIEKNLNNAFDNNLFCGYFQAIIDVNTNAIQGLELLLRWTPNGTIESIADYVEIAENMGILAEITHQSFENALPQFKQWLTIEPNLFLSINLSTKHMKQENMSQQLLTSMQHYDIAPKHLCVEINEASSGDDIEAAMSNLIELGKQGVMLGVDDFGSQAASFSRLRKFNINILKIDMSFIHGIGEKTPDETIIQKIVELGNQLGAQCIAEGVETEQQKAFLASVACPMMQGYLFGKAIPAQEVEQLLIKHTETKKGLK